MSSCCSTLQSQFGDEAARRDLRRYRRRGPLESSRRLIGALRRAGASGRLLDIGGGVGAVPLGLLAHGVDEVESVDASLAYSQVARALIEERGMTDRLRQRVGDFVELADEVEPADVVTLDRVLCCYPDWQRLLHRSAARARSLYGIVVPRDVWLTRLAVKLINLSRRVVRDPYRGYVHSVAAMTETLRQQGFACTSSEHTRIWQVLVFRRAR